MLVRSEKRQLSLKIAQFYDIILTTYGTIRNDYKHAGRKPNFFI